MSPTKVSLDFAVYDVHGQLEALVEAKRRFQTDLPWARAWYSMLQERFGRPLNTWVWLITPDLFYAWPPRAGSSVEPQVFDAARLLDPYFTRLGIPVADVGPSVFEGIVGLWLRDVVDGEPATLCGELGPELLATLRGGDVVSEFAA